MKPCSFLKRTPVAGVSYLLFCAGLAAALLLSGCAATTTKKVPEQQTVKKEPEEKAPSFTLVAPDPPPDPDMLKPGLSVRYNYGFYRHIAQMPQWDGAGKPGKPIPMLNHRFGYGNVFDSGRSQGVGMEMLGFIRFPEPGTYMFQAKTNDGFRMFFNGKTIIDDPTVHSDRFSEPAWVQVLESGWYPFRILYYQRKGTATLELYWKKPGDETRTIVPEKAYAHLPSFKKSSMENVLKK